MCGILGRFGRRSPGSGEELARLVDLLRHRGPDGGACWWDGPFFFGHRRLSIIDIAGGDQPMATADGALVVIYNGEIYNYLELRRELADRGHRFRTQSDTEVLLHGYREWGEELPGHLVGMFAFAIADRPRRELFLARDRFGEKPLLYYENGGSVTFASELAPLSGLPEIERTVDDEALGEYLCLNYVPGERTLMKGVRRLPPGGWRAYSFDAGRQTVASRRGRYWRLPSEPGPELARGEALERLGELVDRSVRISLRSDVPVGILLSGGIDSSLVADSAARQGRLSRAYCLDFAETSHSELGKARAVADRLGLPLTRVVLSGGDAAHFLDLVEHADDPLADSSALAVWKLSSEVARHDKVVLSGDGGDELFGGYLTYRATKLHARLAGWLPAAVRRLMARSASWLPVSEKKVSLSYQLMRFLRAAALPTEQAHFTWNGTWLPAQAGSLLAGDERGRLAAAALERLARRHGLDAGAPGIGPFQHADIGDYLPNDILAKVDRMTMASSLESRAPLLEPTLAEFALRLPEHLKVSRSGQLKWLLRQKVRERFGPEIADAKKQGFSIPIHAWMRSHLREFVGDLLSEASLASVPLLRADAIARARDLHLSGRRAYGFELWGLLVLVAWYRSRILTRPRPGDRPIERIRIAAD